MNLGGLADGLTGGASITEPAGFIRACIVVTAMVCIWCTLMFIFFNSILSQDMRESVQIYASTSGIDALIPRSFLYAAEGASGKGGAGLSQSAAAALITTANNPDADPASQAATASVCKSYQLKVNLNETSR